MSISRYIVYRTSYETLTAGLACPIAGSLAASYNPDLPYQPFELVVLEAALKEVCQSYSTKAKQLEAIINPACDALLKKVP
jgi:acyl-CoA synthetase (AMP-forming)/AMP-acid ligase II